MRSLQLQQSLAAFLEQAAAELQADVIAGQEVPFELETRTARLRGAALYCYRPLTDAFIAERFAALRRLGAYPPALAQLARYDTLERYLLARGLEAPRGSERLARGVEAPRGHERLARGLEAPPGPERLAHEVEAPRGHERLADAVLLALLQEVFEEQTAFDPSWLAGHPERVERALSRLDGTSLPRAGEVTLVATLHGLAIGTPELQLTHGLAIAQPDALQGAPPQALLADRGSHCVPRMGYRSTIGGSAECNHLLVVYTTTDAVTSSEGVAEGVEVIRELLRALRLFGDGRIALGPRAWACAGEGDWNTLALGTGGHPHGMLLVAPEQEDELRAFCNLVSRRAPTGTPIAWALRRYELGCDRPDEHEALSDHLLALRALLAGPSPYSSPAPGGADGLLAARLAALCATPERRSECSERALAAIALERECIAGTAPRRAAELAVARELADHLRALLRDVVCGHLQPDLAAIADDILLVSGVEESAPEQLALPEQELANEADSGEVLRVAV